MTAPPQNGSHGIDVRGLSYDFRGDLVLNDISCSFDPGNLVALLGPSGCGKTTFLRCLSGLLHARRGRVFLDGMPPEEAAKAGQVGNAFQFPTLLPWRTVLENVLLPVEILQREKSGPDRDYAVELIKKVDLGNDMSKFPHQLSGGMQQRVGLARALVTQPSFLFLDEPFGQLDGTTRDDLNEKLRDLWGGERRFTVVFVTHSVEEAVYVAEEVVVFSNKPARIKETVKVPLEKHRPHNVRTSEAFLDCVKNIREITRRAR